MSYYKYLDSKLPSCGGYKPEPKLKKFIVTARPYERAVDKLVPGELFSVMGTYDAIDSNAAYLAFLDEYCKDIRDAQRFYPDVYVIEISETASKYSLHDTFGKLAKFPNPGLFTEEDRYY